MASHGTFVVGGKTSSTSRSTSVGSTYQVVSRSSRGSSFKQLRTHISQADAVATSEHRDAVLEEPRPQPLAQKTTSAQPSADEVVVDEPQACQVADLNTILQERDACGVGFIASLKNVSSHDVVAKALLGLACMEHRGACSADDVSGDGSGVMTAVPWALLKKQLPALKEETSGVAMMFLPNDDALEAQAKTILESAAKEESFKVVGWRKVPIDETVVGRLATATKPRIWQAVIESEAGLTGNELEQECFIVRKVAERRKAAQMGDAASDFYVCSLSNKTIVYKGMLNSSSLGFFYTDLKDPEYTSPFAIYHRRFSTNTTPKWPLAQPMRVLGHNGEINTLQGNLNWVASREQSISNPLWKNRESEFLPLCNAAESDSANLDHVAELLMRSDVPAEEALMILVPEAFRNHPDLMKDYPEAIDFYEYWEGLQEGWDGPALLVFSDGKHVGARLDRNGLRPARFWQTDDDMVYVASEVGVFGDVIESASKVVAKGRLGPGQMVLANLDNGSFKTNTQIAKEVASSKPYKEWLNKSVVRLQDLNASTFLTEPTLQPADALKLQAAMGFSSEDTQMVIEGMAQQGNEPLYCMGDDTPLPVLSQKPHMLYDYFKQRFAQVTNPPIDPLREGLVMSLEMRLGERGNLLQPGENAYSQVLLPSPVLLETELQAIKTSTALHTKSFGIHYKTGKSTALSDALSKLCTEIEAAVAAGCQCVVLSDQLPREEWEVSMPPMPALLAVGAVHHHLIKAGLRTRTSIVVETSQAFSTHHVSMLVGYGAHAVCPYLALETCRQWRVAPRTEALIKTGKVPAVTMADTQKNYKKALEKGILKIMSKMGISLLSCYHGAQIFEIYGLGKDVVDLAFKGSVSRIGGLSLEDIQRESEALWVKGFPEKSMTKLEDYGYIQSKPKGEYHANNQQMAKLLHKAIGLGGKGAAGSNAYDAYIKHFEDAPVHVLRDCLDLDSGLAPIPIEEVEPAANIMARFCTGGMSLGAISRETHETIAVAMNRVGGKSNSGEGGEDPVRWELMQNVGEDGKSEHLPHLKGLRNGDTANSKIKQVASGRFGVTPQFLVNADQLEIKIAQGAKPGEGGQLPGKKVSPYIATLRKSKPGVPLISPPPHHDIYSIEDLAQLIYDLHQVNARAKVSVKLVAQAGIGTVASGVAKANADIIQISGHDGGTGASPISSIKHCGGPVEIGLAEVHQTLTTNELRERVVLRVDGGLRTGRDVLIMAALGGDEYGFGTVAMIATGCIMARVCHTNNCPVGVASQREELRARFPGTPEDLVNYFHFVAEEVRAGLAQLGFKSLDELVGQADVLKKRTLSLEKTTGLDVSYLTQFAGPVAASSSRIEQEPHSNGSVLDDDILADPEIQAAIKEEGSVTKSYDIVNVDRAALGRVGGAIAKLYGDNGFAGNVTLNLTGSGGQSFGCFIVRGMTVNLVGEANDYVGKGMAGGVMSIIPPADMTQVAAEDASIVGNTCLYGATGGRLFVRGRAGERFAVRNSLAEAVVEGAGDHCCEYMTGGTVVGLGSVGRNVAAGMTGGLAYFYDEDDTFPNKVNTEIVAIQRVQTAAGEAQLKELIQEHATRTGSMKAQAILDDWSNALQKFWQLVPPSEASTPEASKLAEESAAAGDEPIPEVFMQNAAARAS